MEYIVDGVEQTCLNPIFFLHESCCHKGETQCFTLWRVQSVFLHFRTHFLIGLVGWGCKIYRLLFCRAARHPHECPNYDSKQSDSEAPVMLELWGMQSTPSFPSLPGSLWLGVVATDRVLSMGQIELKCVLMLNWIVWNRTLYMYKNRSGIK